VVKKAIAKVIGLLVPGGAFIQAIISIYDTVMVFIAKLKKIIQVAMAFLDSMMAIANGVIGAAAAKVESTLAGLLVLAISFLAGFLGLNKIADKVMDIINTKVRAPVDKAIDFVINWIVTTAKSLFKALFGKKDAKPDERTDAQKQTDLNAAIAEAQAAQRVPDASDADIKKKLQSIKTKYKMVSLDLVIDAQDESNETVHVEGEINPKAKTLPTDLSQLPTRFVKLPPVKIGKKIRRQDLETLFPTVKGMHRSHAVGPITGAERVSGLSAASPEVNLSLMKRVENLMQALRIKKPSGATLYQILDVEQIVVKKGEIYLLQRITYQIEARKGAERRIIGEATIEVDYIEEGGVLKAKPRIDVEGIGFIGQEVL
jgi:hypothetical protein